MPVLSSGNVWIEDWRSSDNRWQLSSSIWFLQVQSELLFVGDAGTTEDSGSKAAATVWK